MVRWRAKPIGYSPSLAGTESGVPDGLPLRLTERLAMLVPPAFYYPPAYRLRNPQRRAELLGTEIESRNLLFVPQ
jgi:hypothetical protein